jgi:hypothetical protein
MYLNRTFVMDLSMCLGGSYNPDGKDQEGTILGFILILSILRRRRQLPKRVNF